MSTNEGQRYGVILADPPWTYSNNGAARRAGVHWSAAENHYPALTDADLMRLPVGDLAAPDSVLILWVTWPKLDVAQRVIEAWGFRYVTGLPWIKIVGEPRRNAAREIEITPTFGVGFWFRGCTEVVLIARRGKAKAPTGPYIGLLSEAYKHSRKPANIYEYAEQLPGPWIELFARETRDGWISLGNEIDGRDIRDVLANRGDATT